jgi:hypothetical protein
MPEINDFQDLRIWPKGMDIAEKCADSKWKSVPRSPFPVPRSPCDWQYSRYLPKGRK